MFLLSCMIPIDLVLNKHMLNGFVSLDLYYYYYQASFNSFISLENKLLYYVEHMFIIIMEATFN